MSYTPVAFEVYTNEDFVEGVLIEDEDGPVDLTGADFVVHVRRSIEDLSVVLEASTDNGLLVIADQGATGEMGMIEFNVPAEVTATIPPGEYPFDILWILPDGRRDNIGGGAITFKRGVTRV